MVAPPVPRTNQENRFLRIPSYDWNRLIKDLQDLNAEVQALGTRADQGGDKGDQGPAGTPGAPGEPGSPGAAGAIGAPGLSGSNGLSAYEIAVLFGFTGTIEEWLALTAPFTLSEAVSLRIIASSPTVQALLRGDIPEYWDGGHIDRDYGLLGDSMDLDLTGSFEITQDGLLIVTENGNNYIAVEGI
jgi:hypothetical protein